MSVKKVQEGLWWYRGVSREENGGQDRKGAEGYSYGKNNRGMEEEENGIWSIRKRGRRRVKSIGETRRSRD